MGVGVDGDAGHEPRNPFGSKTRLRALRGVRPPRSSATVVIGSARGDASAVLLQRALDPGEIVCRQGSETRQSPFSGSKPSGVLVGVRALDRIVVVDAIDARARAVAGDDDRGILRRLVGDHAGRDRRRRPAARCAPAPSLPCVSRSTMAPRSASRRASGVLAKGSACDGAHAFSPPWCTARRCRLRGGEQLVDRHLSRGSSRSPGCLRARSRPSCGSRGRRGRRMRRRSDRTAATTQACRWPETSGQDRSRQSLRIARACLGVGQRHVSARDRSAT